MAKKEKKLENEIVGKARLFLKNADRIGRMPLSIWLAWGLFAYAVVPFLRWQIHGGQFGPSLSFFADDAAFGFFAAYRGAMSLILTLVLSFYAGWRAVKSYGKTIWSVFATGILGGILMGGIFVGGTILTEYWWQNDLLLAVSLLGTLLVSVFLLSVYLAVFASIGAFAAKEVK